MAHLLGYDIGTSGTKVVLCDPQGLLLDAATAWYPLHQPQPGWSEQAPEDWWNATRTATRLLLARHPGVTVAAIGLTGQMHGSVLLGADAAASGGAAAPLRRALLWNDQRTGAECDEITRAAGSPRDLVRMVGNAALTGFTLPKLLWVRRHEPRIWAAVRHVLCPKDFIAFRLTGALATDVGDASGMLCFDIDQRAFCEPLLRRLDLDRTLFPHPHESSEHIGILSRHAASELGLATADIPVIIGSGDNQAGAVGAGVVSAGTALMILGTSGVLLAPSDAPLRDLPPSGPVGRLHAFCAATGPRHWCVTGCMLAAGLSLRWARDLLRPGACYDDLLAEAATAPAGCEGLVFLPHLTGERCPHPDPKARGAWIGLTSRHTRAHLLRSVVEGVAFNMAEIVGLARAAGVPVTSLRTSGAGFRSSLWRQLVSDLTGCPVVTTGTEEGGGALGAALLAAVGIGRFRDAAEACHVAVLESGRTEPKAVQPELAATRQIHEGMYRRIAGVWGT
ncbi:MAG: xylulokinase [Phycisphaerae bacterium]|jgi:xylulokinase